jgi:hypothetical protein
VGETLRAALNAIAAVAPEWLRGVARAEWHERYDRRLESVRLPEATAKRDAYALQVGADGYALLDALDRPGTPAALPALPAVAVLRRVWARHYERVTPGAGGSGDGDGTAVRQRALRTRGPDDRVQSPYDPDARFRGRRGREWIGYMVHLTETCDEDAPRLIVHAEAPAASGPGKGRGEGAPEWYASTHRLHRLEPFVTAAAVITRVYELHRLFDEFKDGNICRRTHLQGAQLVNAVDDPRRLDGGHLDHLLQRVAVIEELDGCWSL